MKYFSRIYCIFVLSFFINQSSQCEPFYKAELIFPLEHWHNHASCIVEQPNGDLLVCWFHGSGERTADDVQILGARKVYGETKWRGPFVMADTKEFPDTNCCMFIDPSEKLWLLWPTIIANQWETALMKILTSIDYQNDVDQAPHWQWQEILHIKPGEKFANVANKVIDQYLAQENAMPQRLKDLIEKLRGRVNDKYFRRMGWMTRAHPTILSDNRLIVPLYSDGYSFSLMAITDDWGENWQFSTPLVGVGNIQPSVVEKKDGTLVAIMRDNGPVPKRAHISESKDRGMTWSPVIDSKIPNPGAGLEWIVLQNGEWILIYNDTEKGRHSLAVSISDDEGQTWKWTRHLEKTEANQGSFHYPSIMQSKDGSLHASYSYFLPRDEDGQNRKSIKHAHFNTDWVKETLSD
jgi:predicted neuraminidase